MQKLRNIIFLVIIVGILWHFYSDAYERSGVQGVIEEVRTDVVQIKNNPAIIHTIESINTEIQLLFDRFSNNQNELDQKGDSAPEKPELHAPSEQSFSIHNIEIGDTQSDVEQQAGEPKRSSFNEYGVHWNTYHENYQNFFMVAYDQNDKVVGLYTNQDLLSSTFDIHFDRTKSDVLNNLGEPLQGIQKGFVTYQTNHNDEYHLFLQDNNYVTIFYDKHENDTVTAIQIVSKDLEQQKTGYFSEASKQLREGLEYQLFDLTNATRVKHGLPVLEWDEAVRATARNHSTDMADNNYFSHTNLEGLSPFDRLKEDEIAFRTAGENLASGQSSSIFAHEGLMNSIGHRENILNPDFQFLAVGVSFNEENKPYYTENFRTK
ncbi:Cysteine-rich secretory protein family protein [Oceanobacillus limi]|uniref:Cysteine-rich secretory protein family protein n=1 Tax=Oceanobacillus limi TaxID=930131 RepID=A0A1I0CBM4_9BACI|nr:CAP domain-containing protein [Oceanobacillus limi]SET16502.1 Cysteine-rich secretory protein family protein [Oceanobacillus limi]